MNINNNLYHWYNIILPTNLTSFTNSIGLGVLLFFYIRVKNKIDVQILLVSILYILIIFLAGQQSGRFIIEPYIWLSILAFSNFQKIDKNYSILYLGSLQPIFVSLILIYSIVYIGNGSLYSKFKVNVLERSANGYSLAKWANSKLKNIEEDVVIYTHRSISLPEFKVIPGDFLYYINLDTKKDFDENKEYFQEILRLSPKYILFYGENFRNEKNNPYKNFFRCSGKLLFSSSNVGKEASRNVFLNKTYRQKYAAYIYEFNIKNFPECLK